MPCAPAAIAPPNTTPDTAQPHHRNVSIQPNPRFSELQSTVAKQHKQLTQVSAYNPRARHPQISVKRNTLKWHQAESIMATTPSLLSITEYLGTSYHPDVDFVEGEIKERNVGEYEHSKIQSLLVFLFTLNEKQWGTNALVEQRIRVNPNRARVCDLVILRKDAPRESVITTPPLLCIEILSPEDRLPRAKEVLADYLTMGVENLWLIDPLRRAAFTYNAAGLHEADPTALIIPNTPIHLDLTEAFAALD